MMPESSLTPDPTDALVSTALQALADAVDEGLLLVDNAGRIVLTNHTLRRLFDLTNVDSLAELRTHIAGCVADPGAYLRALEAEAADPDDGEEIELELVRPTWRVLRRRQAAVRDPNGQIIGRLVAYRDVTRDAEISRLKTEFVANVSHELRTPMAAIKGFLDVVIDDEESMPEAQRRQFLAIAREQTHRLSRLIDDLLDISRIEAGRRPRKERPFAVADLLRDVVWSVRPEAAERGLDIELQLPDGSWELVADRDQIAQVLLNLLANAIRFTPAGGRVVVRVEKSAGELRIAVEDTGCGIAPEDLPHVFEKFYRCRTYGAAPPGTGLGLAIAKELTEGHRGRIEVVSEPGVGSTFTVCLPWAQSEVPS